MWGEVSSFEALYMGEEIQELEQKGGGYCVGGGAGIGQRGVDKNKKKNPTKTPPPVPIQ